MNAIANPVLSKSPYKNQNHSANSIAEVSSGEIAHLFEYCSQNMASDSQKLIAALLINATNRRFQKDLIHEHIYLKNDEIPQIQLFNILIEKFPFVKYSQFSVNNAILDTIGDSEEATIMDIGMGQGAQMLNVILSAKKLPGLRKLKIIGVEPFGDALEIAKSQIEAAKSQVHFEIEFISFQCFAEEFDYSAWEAIPGKLIVNASLSLHHIQQTEKRNAVIASIKKMNPAAFILIEPNVNHFEKDFSKRFMNCYHHYYNIFMVIDRLDISDKDKTGLKLFFGREIEDVIGKEEKDRFEKHEKAEVWIERLHNNGFSLHPSILQTPVSSEAGVEIKFHKEGFLGFTHNTETVLAVMYAY